MRIVATSDVPAVAREAFAHVGRITVDETGRPAALADAEVLIVRGGRVDARVLDGAPSLRVIARTGAGYDNIDVEAATRRGVAVVYAPGVGSQPVAEGTIALMLAAAKRLRQLGGLVDEEGWRFRYEVDGLDIAGACVGIVGLGSIGRRVAGLCLALGMEAIAYDPASAEADAPPGVKPVSLEALVARADVITLHCALTEHTRGMIDGRLLSSVKPGAILVNVARGEIVESEDALADALAAGRLSGVALDVFPTEPPESSHRLFADPRVICTPHAVGLTRRWNEEVFQVLARGVASVLAGGTPPNVLNPKALERRRPAVPAD